MRTKIKKGDKVKIVDYGHTFTTYSDMFKLFGFKNKEVNRLPYHLQGLTFKVIDMKVDNSRSEVLVFIKNKNNELLIGLKGINHA